jgi:glycosyltransferase involved in cell wall biosynthesis
MLQALCQLGYSVTLLSSTLSSDTEWTSAGVCAAREAGAADVRIFEPTRVDRKLIGFLKRVHKRRSTRPSVSSLVYTPPGMRVWFAQRMRAIRPRQVVINYAFWSPLNSLVKYTLPGTRVVSTIDTHDILARQTQLRQRIWDALPGSPIDADLVHDDVLHENYFRDIPFPGDAQEFAEYDRFDNTIAISTTDQRIIEAHTKRTNVALIPASFPSIGTLNSYSSPAIFATGPNPFNVHGYVYFVRKVLPIVLRSDPTFRLDVLGYIGTLVRGAPGVNLRGYVPHLTATYAAARFAISPVLGGTGQQVKIVEAMAHGLPVIAFRSVAEGSPIVHEVNGLLAGEAAEFAQHVLRLWRDRDLCRKLGQAARQEIRDHWSQAMTTQQLGRLLSP